MLALEQSAEKWPFSVPGGGRGGRPTNPTPLGYGHGTHIIYATFPIFSSSKTSKTGQTSVHPSVRVVFVKTLRFRKRRADVDETWHV